MNSMNRILGGPATAYFPADIAAEHRELDSSGKEPSTANDIALGLEGVSLSFGGVVALENIDLVVRRGEIRAIIGPNGAGKSSLINIISGVYRPDRGRVRIGTNSSANVPTQKLAHLGIARTFQNLALFKGLSVIDNVISGRAYKIKSTFLGQVLGIGRSRGEEADAHVRATKVLEFLNLTNVSSRLAGTLPYGLQKRVELARALVAEPAIILLDEPMAGMNVPEKTEMTEFIRAANREYGTTIVIIEHDIGVVMELSDHIAVLDYGRKIADGTPEEIRSDQKVIDAYLGIAAENIDGEGI